MKEKGCVLEPAGAAAQCTWNRDLNQRSDEAG